MGKKQRVIFVVTLSVLVIGALVFLFTRSNVLVLQPAGNVAEQQRDLMVIATLLMLIVVLPVFILTGLIAWRYREGNKKAKYSPGFDSSHVLETVWWIIPLAIISVLSVIIWQSSHKLDPFRPLPHHAEPLRVQVVALQWQWLFIYPDQDIASTNYFRFPEDRPVNFELTADAPMNSFWIPQLGGQVYAMSGMSTKLHLVADKPGEYKGMSANISGAGFADMKFIAQATSSSDFDQWVNDIKSRRDPLDIASYNELAKPSRGDPDQTFWLKEDDLYNKIVMKYMSPEHAQMKTAEQEHIEQEHTTQRGEQY